MVLDQLGRLTFREFGQEGDFVRLKDFCDQCNTLGWENNKSLQAMKVDRMTMPYGKYFVGLDGDRFFTVAGVHRIDECGLSGWRCLFRGAQLPGYTPKFSMNMYNSGIQFSYLLYHQIKFVQRYEPWSNFYISTNVDNPDAGKSSRLNNIMMPRLVEQGYFELAAENFYMYGTHQNLWKVNIEKYMADREIWLAGGMNKD